MQLFAVATIKDNPIEGIGGYRILDINTVEVREFTPEQLINALKNNGESFKNIGLVDRCISSPIGINNIPNVLTNGFLSGFNNATALYKVPGYDRYIVADYNGNMLELHTRALFGMQSAMKIYLCNMEFKRSDYSRQPIPRIRRATGILKHEKIDKEAFVTSIKEQYKKFISKTKLMGLDNSFEYAIDGYDVAITRYSGKSDKVIIPSFITIIGEHAFEFTVTGTRINTITLNEGLRVIEDGALGYNDIKQLIVPSTVEIICKGALMGNMELESTTVVNRRARRDIDKNKVTMLNPNTLIEVQF